MVDTVSVSQLNNYISAIIEFDENLSGIKVTGELSNVKVHTSGHIYFTLKDEQSKINGVIFRGQAASLKFRPQDGIKVVVSGRVSVYTKGGTYQIVANSITKAGEGDLYEAYLRLIDEYRQKGYFDADKKKKLPFFPKRIALVTSPTGAAVKDMISVISRRNPAVNIIVCPVKVQGLGSAEEIAGMIDYINKYSVADLIITGRGGGSIEELWAFNERAVIESVYASEIPVISAVGHETDFTVCDFVADMRAATPSVAGELCAFDTLDMSYTLNSMKDRLTGLLSSKTEIIRRRIDDIKHTILPIALTKQLETNMLRLDRLSEGLNAKISGIIGAFRNDVAVKKAILESSSVENTLKRGYFIMTDQNGSVIGHNAVKAGDRVRFMTYEKTLSAEITGTGKNNDKNKDI